MSDKITIVVGVGAILFAFFSPIPWDIAKQIWQNKEKQQQDALERERNEAEARDRTLKQQRRICDELNLRYTLFTGRMKENDRTGAMRAFDTPDGRFKTTDKELTEQSSKELITELLRLSALTSQIDLTDWPPDNEAPHQFILSQIDAFMGEVDRACK